jgi:hypothetical protein
LRKCSRCSLFLLLFLLRPVFFAKQTASSPPPAALAKIYTGFVADWTGELEFRDYQSDGRVKLPTLLDVKLSADGHSLRFHYVYDDGPNKVVENRQLSPSIRRPLPSPNPPTGTQQSNIPNFGPLEVHRVQVKDAAIDWHGNRKRQKGRRAHHHQGRAQFLPL